MEFFVDLNTIHIEFTKIENDLITSPFLSYVNSIDILSPRASE